MKKKKAPNQKEAGEKRYFLIYTVLFLVMTFLVCSWFFLEGKTFIRRNGDGWNQHYKALVYYGRYLRSIIKEFLAGHGLVIPAWDFSIGEGSDILGTLNYYVIGDPFAFFSFLIPTRFMYVFYDAMILLRIYLSGIAFSCLCFHTGKKNWYAVMAGAMVYVFCFWNIYHVAKHPYFLNPMVYFPLLILGVEKILKKQRPHVFIGAVFLSAVSNFYFFYMLVLTTVVYVLVRVIFLYHKDIRSACKMVLRIGVYAVAGVLPASVILLPVCYVFLTSPRMSVGASSDLFYPFDFYVRLPALFVAAGDPQYTCMGFAVPVLFAVFFLFCRRKKYRMEKVLFVICAIVFMVPYLGHALNGFSYAANRWSWAFALICAYILTEMWPALLDLNKKEAAILAGCAIIYFLYCLIVVWRRPGDLFFANIGVAAACALVFLLLIFPARSRKDTGWRKWKQPLCLLLAAISILNNSYWQFAPDGNHYARGGVKALKVDETFSATETEKIKQLAKEDGNDDFFRYSGNDLTMNAGMIAELSSTQFYWTLSNPYMIDFKKNMELTETSASRYEGYCGRPGLLSLASVDYYVVPAEKEMVIPYGFSYADATDDYVFYRNDYDLPLAYTYDTYMLADQWAGLSAVAKEEALLQSVVLEQKSAGFEEGIPVFKSEEIPYTATCKGDVLLQEHAFSVTAKDATVKLDFDGLADSETYLSIEGLSFQDASEDGQQVSEDTPSVTLRIESSEGKKTEIGYVTEKARRYNNRHEFTVDLGYSKEAATSLKIKFSKKGIYRFDSMKVICRPIDNYGSCIADRKSDMLARPKIGTNTVTGKVSFDEKKLLCLSIPYTKGWHAYIDGSKTELLRANVQYMALAVDAGEHEIRLVYATPLMKEGAYLSVVSMFALAVLAVIRKRRGACGQDKTDYTENIYR